MDTLGMLFAALLTVMVLSYLIGDNVLFRIATYLFVGIASGYAGAVAWFSVIRPGLIDPLIAAGPAGLIDPGVFGALIIPWLLAVLLLLKISPMTTRYGNVSVAILVGVGAGVIVGGGITGTLIPQTIAATDSITLDVLVPQTGQDLGLWAEEIMSGFVILIAAISTLLFFRFAAQKEATGTAHRSKFNAIIAYIGQVFIALTFGVMYAGALAATVIILSERFQMIGSLFRSLLGGA